MKHSRVIALLSALFLVLSVGVAHADNVKSQVAVSGGVGQNRHVLPGGTTEMLYYVERTGQVCDPASDAPATLTFNHDSVVTASPASITISACGDAAGETVAFSAPTAGRYTITTNVSDPGSTDSYNTNAADFNLIVNTPPTISVTGVEHGAEYELGSVPAAGCYVIDPEEPNATATPVLTGTLVAGLGEQTATCTFTDAAGAVASASVTYTIKAEGGDENSAPSVLTAADDDLGTEGDTLGASGAFSDADNDDLVLTADNGTVGTFTDNGDGTWDWTLDTTDDVARATITVTATDSSVSEVTDEFDYEAANADPTIDSASLGSAHESGCDVTLSATYSDVGTDDTHTAVIAWGDGTDTESLEDDGSNGHSYASAGTYNATLTVTDDDLGEDSWTNEEAGGHTAFNRSSAILQPINSTGNRSGFKLGSTIPVKVQVKACNNSDVSDLTIPVSLAKLDANADVAVSELVSSAAPTSGTDMRWSTDQYIYNLSTKNSQFQNNTALGGGTYRVRVRNASFSNTCTNGTALTTDDVSGCVEAWFDLRK